MRHRCDSGLKISSFRVNDAILQLCNGGSNAGANTWEEDILGVDVLASGSSVSINFDDGTGSCNFDFKAVFPDGDEVVQPDVDVCTIGTFTFN